MKTSFTYEPSKNLQAPTLVHPESKLIVKSKNTTELFYEHKPQIMPQSEIEFTKIKSEFKFVPLDLNLIQQFQETDFKTVSKELQLQVLKQRKKTEAVVKIVKNREEELKIKGSAINPNRAKRK
ncbi:Hypothetical_protein [Hexamita inflata]|uniref:Hypothetical_protein n=1 Tax=Hexamita inflata TaxID=28002 RepID=A0AA86TJY9_9EUKA|nr:Hypothetical protein HINF_LOCUS7171 [Hexamita inflata]CAI9947342.1 Hypothetical protein HINF_LOCUS34987 [Hexamita inflata]